MTETCTSTVTKVVVNQNIDLPKLYSVVMFNDDVTTTEFVIQTLIEVFGLGVEPALGLTKSINDYGFGVAASGITEELANHLANLVRQRAAAEQFPLVVEVRAE